MNCINLHRAVEWAALYLVIPLVFYFDLVPIPKLIGLAIVAIACLGVLWHDSAHHFKKNRQFLPENRTAFLIKIGLATIGMIILTLILRPHSLFSFPRNHPFSWLVVMILYPLLSALPQEIIYRKFFFYRYPKLFRSDIRLMIASACSFSFLHIVYDNIWAVLLAFVGGLLFSRTYQKSRSLWVVTLEHAIYGCLLFTIGLGVYF